jgi:hypothetical protein
MAKTSKGEIETWLSDFPTTVLNHRASRLLAKIMSLIVEEKRIGVEKSQHPWQRVVSDNHVAPAAYFPKAPRPPQPPA